MVRWFLVVLYSIGTNIITDFSDLEDFTDLSKIKGCLILINTLSGNIKIRKCVR